MEQMSSNVATAENRVKTFRWYFYIAVAQFLLYFIVPWFLFPRRVIVDIEIISALTLGILVGAFLLLVALLGLFLDRTRRIVYVATLSGIAVYFSWALVSWAFIEHMDYLLR